MIHQVSPACNDLILIDPDVALSREDIDMRAGLPRSVSLIPIRIAEGDVDAGEFFVLQQDSDELR